MLFTVNVLKNDISLHLRGNECEHGLCVQGSIMVCTAVKAVRVSSSAQSGRT